MTAPTQPYSSSVDAYTGQGVTVSLAGVTACVKSLTLPTFTQDAIEIPCLTDGLGSFKKKMPGGLVDAGEIQIVCLFNNSIVIPEFKQETLTVTFADQAGTALSGTGFVSSVDHGSAETGSVMEMTITFVFDGETGPATA
jgi:hypothetical protein